MTTYQVRLKKPGSPIIDLGPPKYASRESKGVWANPLPDNPKSLWKIYTNQKTFTQAYKDMVEADRRGLPVPSFLGIPVPANAIVFNGNPVPAFEGMPAPPIDGIPVPTADNMSISTLDGIPVPTLADDRAYQFRSGPTAAWEDAYILQTATADTENSRFFAMSQTGKKTVWKTWLYELDLVKDKAVLDKARAAAQAAADIGLRDPQGFLDKNRREPVLFIDVHLASPPSPGANEMLEQIVERMNGPTVN
ncbi:hypothetical protein C8T65DRAFT_735646 [Cerioporus squamosus]|nr:hypothetical protein C8T65DRAFT_735646 [Cerioporus squamosus]